MRGRGWGEEGRYRTRWDSVRAGSPAGCAATGGSTTRPKTFVPVTMCSLLTLPRHEAGDLLAKLGGQGSRKGEALATLLALNAQQALCVLGQRLDIGGS